VCVTTYVPFLHIAKYFSGPVIRNQRLEEGLFIRDKFERRQTKFFNTRSPTTTHVNFDSQMNGLPSRMKQYSEDEETSTSCYGSLPLCRPLPGEECRNPKRAYDVLTKCSVHLESERVFFCVENEFGEVERRHYAPCMYPVTSRCSV
jgi:hypothetical protein